MDYTTLSRLKLQSLCVKYGLDASGKNEDLIQRLQAHAGQTSKESVQTSEDNTAAAPTRTRTTNSAEASRTDVTVETLVQLEVSVKQEEEEQDGLAQGKDGQHGSLESTSIKQEEETLVAVDPVVSPEVKQEATHPSEMENPFLVKSEERELTRIKSESEEPEVKEEADLREVAKSRKALQAFWETRSARGQLTDAKVKDSQPPTKVTGKRARSSTIGDNSDANERGRSTDREQTDSGSRSRSPSDPLPRSGTVRKLIGRFASGAPATPEPVASPSATKRQRLDPKDAPPTSPSVTRVTRSGSGTSTTSFITTATIATGAARISASPKPKLSRREAAAEAARRVIRVPKQETSSETSTSTSTTTPTPPPPSTTPRRVPTTPKRKAPSTDDYPGLETPTKRTYTGTGRVPTAETINRLATPKNKSLATKKAASSSTSATAASTSAPAPPTPTRPRAPVLSTASRAAQRVRRGQN